MSKPREERTHRQEVEAGKRDAFRSQHDHINKIGFSDAWKKIADRDAGLPKIPPEMPDDAKRAIVGLARWAEELEYEWS